MRKFVYMFTVLVLLALGSGCAEFKTYMKNRGNDLADCFTVRGGLSYGLGVRAQLTDYVSASVGGCIEKKKVGNFGRATVNTEGVWFGPPVLSVVFFYSLLSRGTVDSEGALYSLCAFSSLFALLTDCRSYNDQALPAAFSILGVNLAELGADTYEMYGRIRPPTPFLRENFFVEVGAVVGAVSLDVGFNLVEFVDFLLGWFTIDITGDDKETAYDIAKKLDSQPLEKLIGFLKSEESVLRISAARVLAHRRDKSAVEPLVDALKDLNSDVHYAVIQALGKIGGKKAVEALIGVVRSDEGELVQSYAVEALGEMSDKRAVEPLIEKLEYREGHLHFFAAEALRKLTNQDFGTDHAAWKAWYEKNKDK